MAKLRALKVGVVFIASFLMLGYYLQEQLFTIYESQASTVIKDRNEEIIAVKPNNKGYWSQYSDEIPVRFKQLLIEKEDQHFYHHLGFNPVRTAGAVLSYLKNGRAGASSTITQQLVKTLLGNENERNLKNKIIESFYVLGLETYQGKEAILKMYVNSVYFGNQIQGLAEASRLYFNLPPDLLTDGQILQLLAAISNPTENNPTKPKNKETALLLAKNLNLIEQDVLLYLSEASVVKGNMRQYSHFNDSYFEIKDLPSDKFILSEDSINHSSKNQQLTIDKELTEKIRIIVARNIGELRPKNANNGAVIVIKLPENEALALVGSPDPQSFEEGYKINMLLEPRPIGSTIKPFVYLKAFEKGLRPYTLVDDREYKYITAAGFPLYPKNFDYKYRGEVNLHYALSNSLNVPAVKVLECVGLENFYDFLENDLEFKPVQSLENYQLGIALGVLEMSLLDLAHYFTIFPSNGILRELKIYSYAENLITEKQITEPKYIQLINKILQDRQTGVEQFGLKSDFNLFQSNYGLKTGTSRDFHDSWVVGYTPDFLVGVWVGNSDNSPMEEISGQLGAGRIWAEAIGVLLNSEYNKKTPFEFNLIKEFHDKDNLEYGLADDNYEKYLNALKELDSTLILSPHDGDAFLLEKNTEIALRAKEDVRWFVNNVFLGRDKEIIFQPQKGGNCQIRAERGNGSQETITIWLNEEN